MIALRASSALEAMILSQPKLFLFIGRWSFYRQEVAPRFDTDHEVGSKIGQDLGEKKNQNLLGVLWFILTFADCLGDHWIWFSVFWVFFGKSKTISHADRKGGQGVRLTLSAPLALTESKRENVDPFLALKFYSLILKTHFFSLRGVSKMQFLCLCNTGDYFWQNSSKQ